MKNNGNDKNAKKTNDANNENKNDKKISINLEESEEDEESQSISSGILNKIKNEFKENNNNNYYYNEQFFLVDSNDNNNILTKKKKIFKVIKINIHDCNTVDNIKQNIMTNFINFFIIFINFIVNKKLNTNDKIFHIRYQMKNKIKIKHLKELTVKDLLEKYTVDQYNKIKNEISSPLDILLKTLVIDIFLDIFCKNDFKSQKDKEIDLAIYGLEGIVFTIDETIPTFEKLKNENRNNKTKLNKLEKIKNEIIKLKKTQKTQKFRVLKKSK